MFFFLHTRGARRRGSGTVVSGSELREAGPRHRRCGCGSIARGMPEVCSESARGGKEEFWKKVKRYFLLCGPPVHGSIAKTTARPHVRPHGARWYRHPSRRSTRALPSRRRNRRRRARRCTVAPTHLAQCGWRRGGPEQRAPLLRASRAIMMSHQHRHRRLCTCRTNRGPGGSLPCEPSWSRLQNSYLGKRCTL